MVRFVLKRVTRNMAHVQTAIETVDIDTPQLEQILRRGGYGGGVDNDDFDYTELIGAEVRKEAGNGE